MKLHLLLNKGSIFKSSTQLYRKNLLVSFIFFVFINMAVFAQNDVDKQAPVLLADPAVFVHNGKYYLCGTVENNANNGFIIYQSTDLKQWHVDSSINNGWALRKGEAFGSSRFWAPQVFAANDSFYMAYAADEQIAIAIATSPAGPFRQKVIQPLYATVKQIDPFIFIDDDGKKYLYHVRLQNGNRIFVAAINDHFTAIDSTTLTECITATQPWENTANSSWPVTEGPSVIKHNGLYYLFYSANDFRNPAYAVGYAVATSPFGPWKKYDHNPIISRNNIGINGTGHGDFFIDNKHRLTYVMHTHFSNSSVKHRKTALINVKFLKNKKSGIDRVEADSKSFHYLMLNK